MRKGLKLLLKSPKRRFAEQIYFARYVNRNRPQTAALSLTQLVANACFSSLSIACYIKHASTYFRVSVRSDFKQFKAQVRMTRYVRKRYNARMLELENWFE